MNVLLALKLSSDSLMVAETTACKHAQGVNKLFLFTDKKYQTEIDKVQYFYLSKWISTIPVIRVFARIPKMLRICCKEKIDMLICYHLTAFAFPGYIVSRLFNIPISLHFLGKDLDVLCKKPIIGALLLKFASMVDIITVQGTTSKQFLEKKGLKNVFILPTACNLKNFSAPKKQEIYHIIFSGRLSSEKRIDRFIEVVYLLNKKCSIKAVILGTGPDEKKMLRHIKAYNLEKCIKYIGWTNNVYRYLQRSKIFVLTSDNDQLPSSLIEAMATGLVPVVSNVGNISDVVNDKNGFIIHKDNITGFVDAIIHLLNNDEVYSNKSKEALKKAREFSIEANSKRWGAIFECWSKNSEK